MTNLSNYVILKMSDLLTVFIIMEELKMIQRLNLMISKSRVWIFICAALYKFTFWIIDMVNDFKWSAGSGVRSLFSGLFGMVFYLVELAILLEISRKIAEKYTQADFPAPAPRPQAPMQPAQPMQPQMPAQPAQPAQPAAPAQPAQPAAPSGVWYCASCGTQNTGAGAFCSKCGKPK